MSLVFILNAVAYVSHFAFHVLKEVSLAADIASQLVVVQEVMFLAVWNSDQTSRSRLIGYERVHALDAFVLVYGCD